VSGTRVKDQILEQKMFPVLLSLRKTTRVLGALRQEAGAETDIYFFLLFHSNGFMVYSLSVAQSDSYQSWLNFRFN